MHKKIRWAMPTLHFSGYEKFISWCVGRTVHDWWRRHLAGAGAQAGSLCHQCQNNPVATVLWEVAVKKMKIHVILNGA
jgi:hypothetical protein